LINNGFTHVDKYSLNSEGEPYALVNEDIYTLSEWIEGRECDFHNDDDIVIAAKALANMHIASKGYDPPENSKLKTDLGRWPHLMEKRVKALDKMRDMSRKRSRKGEFDVNYVKNVEFYKELGKRAIKVLDDSNYMDICRVTDDEKSFCHHDYTYHNIIIDKDDNVNIIDFDYCKREVRTYDISNFMTKVLKRREWDINCANLIINAYNEVSPLSKDEYRVLFAFLLFPQRFWRLGNRYYYNEVNWATNTFNKKIQALISEQEQYMKFIDEFKKVYNQQEEL
jgi:CotS family spore coat protein